MREIKIEFELSDGEFLAKDEYGDMAIYREEIYCDDCDEYTSTQGAERFNNFWAIHCVKCGRGLPMILAKTRHKRFVGAYEKTPHGIKSISLKKLVI